MLDVRTKNRHRDERKNLLSRGYLSVAKEATPKMHCALVRMKQLDRQVGAERAVVTCDVPLKEHFPSYLNGIRICWWANQRNGRWLLRRGRIVGSAAG